MKTLAVLSEFAASDQHYVARYLDDLYSRAVAETGWSAMLIDVSDGASDTGYTPRNTAIERLPLSHGIATGRLLSLIARADAVHVTSPFGAAGEVCVAISAYAGKAIGAVQLTRVPESLLSTTRLSRSIRHVVAPNSYLANHLNGTLGCPVFTVLPRIAPVFRPPEVSAKGRFFVVPPCLDTDWPGLLAAVPPGAQLCVLGRTGDSPVLAEIARRASVQVKVTADLSDDDVCDALQRAPVFLDWPVSNRIGGDAQNDMTAFSYAVEALACGTPAIVSGFRSYSRDLRNLADCSIVRTPAELAASASRFAAGGVADAGEAARIAREARLATNSARQLRSLADAIGALADRR